MADHVDILAETESMNRPLVASVALHLGVAGLLAAGSWLSWNTRSERWGDLNAGGGAVGVNPVASIPMPVREGLMNPLASDTQSRVPMPPEEAKPKPREVEAPKPNAVEIPDRKSSDKKKKQPERRQKTQRYRQPGTDKSNQLYSSAGQALVSPMIGKSGAGGVGIGTGSPLGERFGAYAALVQQLIAQRWQTHDVDPRVRSAPPVVVAFKIHRDGTVQGIRLQTSSGNKPLDLSALRAVYDVGKFPPLPAAYSGSSADIELWFQLKR